MSDTKSSIFPLHSETKHVHFYPQLSHFINSESDCQWLVCMISVEWDNPSYPQLFTRIPGVCSVSNDGRRLLGILMPELFLKNRGRNDKVNMVYYPESRKSPEVLDICKIYRRVDLYLFSASCLNIQEETYLHFTIHQKSLFYFAMSCKWDW